MGSVRKSRIIRIPQEAWEKELKRKNEMELRAKQLTGKPIRLSFADYFRIRTSKPIFILDKELVELSKKRVKWRMVSI